MCCFLTQTNEYYTSIRVFVVDAGKNKILRQKAGSKRWIPAARDPKQTDLSHNAALSLSPCQTPSQLDLDFPAVTLEPDDTSSSLQSGTHKNDLYGSAPSSDCVQWNGDCMQELPSGKGPERLFSQEKIVSEVYKGVCVCRGKREKNRLPFTLI